MFPYIYFLFSFGLPFLCSRAFFLFSFPPFFFPFSFSFPSLLLIFLPLYVFALPSPSSPYVSCFTYYFMFVVHCLASRFVLLLRVPTCWPIATLRFCMLLHVPRLLLRSSHLRFKVFIVTPSPLLFCCLLLPCVSWYPTPFHVFRWRSLKHQVSSILISVFF